MYLTRRGTMVLATFLLIHTNGAPSIGAAAVEAAPIVAFSQSNNVEQP
jgi:hypothetical protein